MTEIEQDIVDDEIVDEEIYEPTEDPGSFEPKEPDTAPQDDPDEDETDA